MRPGIVCSDISQIFIQPGTPRLGPQLLDNMNPLSILQRFVKRTQRLIYISRMAQIPQIGMDSISEIYRRCTLRKFNDFALGSINTNLFAKNILNHSLYTGSRILRFNVYVLINILKKRFDSISYPF